MHIYSSKGCEHGIKSRGAFDMKVEPSLKGNVSLSLSSHSRSARDDDLIHLHYVGTDTQAVLAFFSYCLPNGRAN